MSLPPSPRVPACNKIAAAPATCGVEKLEDLLGNGRAAGDDDPDLPSERLPDLLEDEPVCQAVFQLVEKREGPTFLQCPASLGPDSLGPVEDRLLERGAFRHLPEDTAVHFLEDARHTVEDSRLDLL